jgi:SPP1 family predicted phage head-tail adaptor
MYDDVAILKAYGAETFDEYGNQSHTITERKVYVEPRGVYSSEFYNAAQVGLKPSITLRLTNRADYNGEKIVEYAGTEYDVIRADWNAQRDRIDLVCEERVG